MKYISSNYIAYKSFISVGSLPSILGADCQSILEALRRELLVFSLILTYFSKDIQPYTVFCSAFVHLKIEY